MTFKCRICGHTEYEQISKLVTRIDLTAVWKSVNPRAYECCGCSVTFADVGKFNIE